MSDTLFPDGTPIGLNDATGTPIRVGDRVLYKLDGTGTKPEYHNPEYVVVYAPPMFTLRHVGGGKDGDNHIFKLKHGGSNKVLFVINHKGTPTMPINTYFAAEPEEVKAIVYRDTAGKSHMSRDAALAANVALDVEQALRRELTTLFPDEHTTRADIARDVMALMKSDPKLFAAFISYADAT